jgi:hypothetical protein
VTYDSHFAFTRIRYGARVGRGASGWEHDYPTADRNFAAILDYITNMRVHLDGSNILDLDDPRIFENPVIYMSEPGYWTTDEAEAANLRAYLLKGGFIIFDDFDGAAEWQNLVRSDEAGAAPAHLHSAGRVAPDLPVVLSDSRRSTSRIRCCQASSRCSSGSSTTTIPSGRMLGIANFNNDIWRLLGVVGRRSLRRRSDQRRLSSRRGLSRLRHDPLNARFHQPVE